MNNMLETIHALSLVYSRYEMDNKIWLLIKYGRIIGIDTRDLTGHHGTRQPWRSMYTLTDMTPKMWETMRINEWTGSSNDWAFDK